MTDQARQITVYLQGPLLLGDESGVGNYEQTLGYIPGSVLRGALATHILHADEPAFQRVFVAAERPPRFGNAYPAWPEVWAYPFPATARTCKQYHGYATDKHEGHGVFDILVEQTLYELISDPQFPHRESLLPALGTRWVELANGYEPRCPYEQDEKCGEQVKPATGYYVLRSGGPGPSPKPLISRATHVGINRARGVAEDNLLFTLETIESTANLQFRGQLIYDDAYEDDLEQLIGLRGQVNTFRIGRGRSRGMGLTKIQIDVPPSVPGEKIKDHLDLLQREFRKAVQEHYAQVGGLDFTPGYFFSLTLRAPAVLASSDGLSSLWPDLSQTKLAAAWPLRAWARTTVVGGWDAAAGLPRRTRQAVEAGAVYLYYAPETGISRAALVQALEKLELEGIGAQRERGYGQLTVCAPFHCAGWSNGDIITRVQPAVSESRETKLIRRAQKTVEGAKITASDEENLKPSQVQLLLREAQAGYGVEHVLNWLRYQQARVKAWQESGLAEKIAQDIDALYQEARDILEPSGVEITKKRLGAEWADLVQDYLAYLLHWYQVALQRRGGGE